MTTIQYYSFGPFVYLINSSANTYDVISDSIPDSVSGLPVQQLLPPVILPVNGDRNYSSYVNSDITNIIHVPSKTRIEVHLHKSSRRRCQNPYLRGRLSGWSLSSIDFEFEENYTDVLVGVYDLSSLPISGTYYLEIIILLCERYSEEYVRNTTKNLVNVCLENPVGGANRITQANASVQIQLQIEDGGDSNFPFLVPNQHRWRRLLLDESSGPNGRWMHKSLVETHTTPRNDSNAVGKHSPKQPITNATIPLYTRCVNKQCSQCFHWNSTKEEKEGQACQNCVSASVSGVSQFNQYTYRWSDGPHEMLNQPGIRPVLEKYTVEPHRPTMVCFVGASHSSVLNGYCKKILRQSRDVSTTLVLECQQLYFMYPHNLTKSSILALLEEKQRCTHVVIGLFQFPFCYHESTIQFPNWKRDMTTVVEIFKSAVASPKNRLEKILLRSAHPNALGFDYYKCPAYDFRTVPNAKMATSLLKEIVETHAIDEDSKEVLSLVDTSFLIDPVWDSAADMSHYDDENTVIGVMEAKYILWKIFSERKNVV